MTKLAVSDWSHVESFRDSIRIDLEHLRAGIENVHVSLGAQLHDFTRHVDERADQMLEDQRDEWYEWNSDRHWELSEVYPRLVRHSMFVASYSFLEHTLMKLCHVLAEERPQLVGLRDLHGGGIERARTYLLKVQAVRFPADSPEWARLADYRRMRNAIVHADGHLRDQQDAKLVRAFLAANHGLATIDQFQRISLELHACKDFLSTTETFLTTLLSHVPA